MAKVNCEMCSKETGFGKLKTKDDMYICANCGATCGKPSLKPISNYTLQELLDFKTAKEQNNSKKTAQNHKQSIPIAPTEQSPIKSNSASESAVLKQYSVLYHGGHPNNPKKAYNIEFLIHEDRFSIRTKLKQNFTNFEIMYHDVANFDIVARQVSTVEGILGGINSRQLNQDNNINITYRDEIGMEYVIRLEMITGITVMGQAGKCREMMDFLRVNGVLSKFKQTAQVPSFSNIGTSEEILKFKNLLDQGIITQEEFDAKKKQLLGL